MITYSVSPADLGQIRFGISPLSETSLSLRLWVAPQGYPRMASVLRSVAAHRDELDMAMLSALMTPGFRSPDFLNPRPERALPRFEDEVGRLASMPLRQFEADIREPYSESIPEPLTGRPASVRTRLLDAISGYWALCIEPHWRDWVRSLQGDIAHRSIALGAHGLNDMLGGLSSGLSWNGEEFTLASRFGPSFECHTAGRGVVLVPSHFTLSVSHPLTERFDPMIVYPVRAPAGQADAGVGTAGALVALLGRSRAQILGILATPMSSTALAEVLTVTPSAANQHLRVLLRSGLVHSARAGKSVTYWRSRLGDEVLAGHG